MDRAVTKRPKPDHLICRSGWALLITAACVYFAYRSYSELRAHDYEWSHNWWDTLTWLIWMVVAAGLISEVRCWRERMLFGVLLTQCLIGCGFAAWASAPVDLVRQARLVAVVLWSAAVLLSVLALLSRRATALPVTDEED